MTSLVGGFKRAMLGRPMATAEEQHERLSKKVALAVFSSDAISSTAYATEEILLMLVLAGAAATQVAIPIAGMVAFLLLIVALSYRQTVYAYPNGGGSYVVASENLGLVPGLVAAASLLVDYVMTVAVSVASGVAAITSAFPILFNHRILIAVLLVALVAVVNLRGMRESGAIFAFPTYAFIALCGGLLVVGAIRAATGHLHAVPSQGEVLAQQGLTVFLVLKAFAGGCSAMTGTEAISNGVPAFKKPESKNAATTLMIMAAILGILFVGITALTLGLGVLPKEADTVLSQVGRAVYGGGFLYYALQIATMAILILASNTSFNGFPRLAAIMAEHSYFPRQFQNRGDRLVFSNGVVGLAIGAIALLVVFRASVHRMIPLYAIGVFTGFTLSQSGMVRHWWKLRDPGWRFRAGLNGLGAVIEQDR
ncbi:MAG: APC family permease, partial [Actinobacteria bacterium]|nr:APC family permease [Actinomycetota bacterium]